MSDALSDAPRATSPAKSGQVLWLTVGVALVLIAIASAALLLISRDLHVGRSTYSDIVRTRATLDLLHLVFASLQDAETGAQGYLLTGNDESLAPYYAAERSLDSQLNELTQLASEGEVRQMAAELVTHARAQLTFLGGVVATRRSQGAAAVVDLLRSGVGDRRMDR